jgi:hypothetical protein
MDQKTIDKFNPNKFRELTKEDIEAMRNFQLNDVAALAKAYPNKPTERAYLVLFDTTDKAKQLYPLSTWQNLLALWKQQLTKYVAFNFSALHNNKTISNQATKTGPVQDLTTAEVQKAIKTVPGKKPVTPVVTVAPKQTPTRFVKPPVGTFLDESDGDYLGSDADVDHDFEKEEIEASRKADNKKKTAPKQPVKPVKTVALTGKKTDKK